MTYVEIINKGHIAVDHFPSWWKPLAMDMNYIYLSIKEEELNRLKKKHRHLSLYDACLDLNINYPYMDDEKIYGWDENTDINIKFKFEDDILIFIFNVDKIIGSFY